MDNKLLLSITEAAKILSISRGSIYNLHRVGALKLVKIGSASRITMESIHGYIDAIQAIEK